MRLLVDNARSPLGAGALKEKGFDVVHVRDLGLAAASDEEIFNRAQLDNRVLISADTDFAILLARRQSNKPSVILFRRGADRRPEKQVALLLANLDGIAPSLETGSIVIFEQNRIRIRPLPIL